MMPSLMISFTVRLATAAAISMPFIPLPAMALDDIQLPPGFEIEEYADIPGARSLTLGARGTDFVHTRKAQSIYVIVDEGDGTRVVEIIDGLRTPNGIVFHEGDLYVAETDRITRYDDIESTLSDVPEGVELDIDLPSERHHSARYIDFGPDGKLYVTIGAPCNVCEKDGFGTIVRMNPDGSDREVFAHGVRNSVGLSWHPDTGQLWFTDNGRDMLGDDLPPDELNNATAVGQHYGFPYCHAGFLLDPRLGDGRNCGDYRPPALTLGAHVAPLGLTFYTGSRFPAEYHGQLFIAEHGSWNRSKKAGYRIMLVDIKAGKPVSYQPFASGWLQDESVSGRPVDLLVLADGSMLVSDDHAGEVYRISYTGEETEGQDYE